MAVDLTSLNTQMQVFLKTEGAYSGLIDGKLGPQTLKAIAALLKEYGIKSQGWTNTRLIIALEQLFYKSKKIPVGKIDGFVGPDTKHARDLYNAKQVTTWRDNAEELVTRDVVKVVPAVTVKTSSPTKVMQWPTQSGVPSFFGAVGKNQDDCILPYPMVIAWDTKSKLNKFSCHKLVKAPLERIWGRVFEYYGYEKIKELRLDYWGGCLNVRKIRGGSGYSMHSWGIAVDMDPDRNEMQTSWKNANFSKPEYKKYWEFVYDEGAISLGIERNFDPMHFQFARLG